MEPDAAAAFMAFATALKRTMPASATTAHAAFETLVATWTWKAPETVARTGWTDVFEQVLLPHVASVSPPVPWTMAVAALWQAHRPSTAKDV